MRTKNELPVSIKEKKIELLNLYAKMHAGREKNVKKAKNLRKEIARLLTESNKKGDKK